MRLRPYMVSADYEYLAKWVEDERIHALWCANKIPYPLSADKLQEILDIEAKYRNSHAYIVTEDDGERIGFFVLAVNLVENYGHLKFVVINDKLRGQGYGTQMSKLILKFAFEICGVLSVQLNVFDINESAIKSYSKVGFVIDSITKDAFSYKEEIWGRCHMMISK